MDAKTAKRVPITDFLAALGYEPASVRGADRWYASPFRHEKTPSFKVDAVRNLWYDHGEGVGGTVIDLAMRLNADSDVARAIRTISDVAGNLAPLPAFRPKPQAAPPAAMAAGSVLEESTPLRDPALVRYLEKDRAVPLALAFPFVREVRYRTSDGKRFTAIAFQNRSGGFELRNPKFKGTLGTKDITVVGDPHEEKVRVFEGFSDFLSALVLWPEFRGKPAVVLNSVSMAAEGAAEIRRRGCAAACHFDADLAGSRALAAFREMLGPQLVTDERASLDGCKDLNELLVKRASPTR